MFICDCHCDTLTELYKKGTSLYDNDQHFDIKRQIELGGGLQFCAIFVPTHEFRYYGGLRYTLCLLDKYKQELKALQEKGIDVLPVLTKADAADEEDSVDLGGRRIIKKKKTLQDYGRH